MWFLEESGRLLRNKATPHLDGFLPLYELLSSQHESQKSTQSRHTTFIWLPKQSKKVNEEKWFFKRNTRYIWAQKEQWLFYITLESKTNWQKFLSEGLCASFCINASSFSFIMGRMTAAFIACKQHIGKHGADLLLWSHSFMEVPLWTNLVLWVLYSALVVLGEGKHGWKLQLCEQELGCWLF